MSCLHCGWCCIELDVFIRVGDNIAFKPNGVRCPYLVDDERGRNCKVHEEDWYREMPCFAYANPDVDPDFENQRGKPCRVGQHLLQSPRHDGRVVAANELRVMGSWAQLLHEPMGMK